VVVVLSSGGGWGETSRFATEELAPARGSTRDICRLRADCCLAAVLQRSLVMIACNFSARFSLLNHGEPESGCQKVVFGYRLMISMC
jgi:hypothetical protein